MTKSITETTTLAELREQLLFFKVIALRIHPPIHGKASLEASLHHATGFHVGLGSTEAMAIEDAFVSLRRTCQ